VDVCAAVVANEESFELVEPGEGTFDDPAVAAEARAVLGLASCDLWGDPERTELAAVLVVVVAAVSGDSVGSAARPADLATDGRDAFDERDQLGDVVAIAARERPRERDPRRVYEKVMLRAASGSINRARARFGAPFFACTWLESATARSHSINPFACNSASKTAWSRSQTPARCH
jgi:hypothetical protein